MPRILTSFLFLLALACASPDAAQRPAPPAIGGGSPIDYPADSETRPIVDANTAFAVDIWKRIDERAGNIAFSPASISAALTLTWAGAKGETAAQIGNVLHLQGDARNLGNTWGRLIRAMEDPSHRLVLRFADRLYAQNSYAFDKSFLSWSVKGFGASIELTDFKGAADVSRRRINGWVDDRTQHRVHDLLPEGRLGPDTRLVLVNALYFLAAWEYPFEKEATVSAAFFVAPGKSRDIPTMHLEIGSRAAQVGDAKVLILPYKYFHAQMVVVLPDKVDGLGDIERNLSAKTVDSWMSAPEYQQKVIVSLPRFEVDQASPLELSDTLRGMGMPAAFDREHADFSGIAKPRNPADRLYVGSVIHKAFVKVDEEGAEAAATTVVDMPTAMSAPMRDPPPPPPPFVFRADHPFLYFIVDRASGMILFMGRVNDPSAK